MIDNQKSKAPASKARAVAAGLVVFAIAFGLVLVWMDMMRSGVDPTSSVAWMDMMLPR